MGVIKEGFWIATVRLTSKPDCLSKEQVRNKLQNEIREIIGLLSKGGVIFVFAT